MTLPIGALRHPSLSLVLAACAVTTGCAARRASTNTAAAAPSVQPAEPALAFDWNESAIRWSSYEEARAEAAKDEKPLLVLFYATWCSASASFVANVISDENVANASRRFAMLRVDIDEQAALVEQLGRDVTHVPSVLFFGPAGQQLEVEAEDGGESRYSYSSYDPDALLRGMSEALVATGGAPLDLPHEHHAELTPTP